MDIRRAAGNGYGSETAKDLRENRIFKKLLFGKKEDLTFQIQADEDNVMHADVVGADDAGPAGKLIFSADDPHAEKNSVEWP